MAQATNSVRNEAGEKRNPPSELARLRKKLQKAADYELLQGDLFILAFQFMDREDLSIADSDVSLLFLALFRQLKRALLIEDGDITQVVDLVHTRLTEHLLPGGNLADLLIRGIESGTKPIQPRSMDVLSAIVRMAECLPPPREGSSHYQGFLTPLFLSTVSAGLKIKSSLSIANTIIDVVPASAIPSSVLDSLLGSMCSNDSASARSSIIVKLLLKSSDIASANSKVIGVLVDLLHASSNDGDGNTLTIVLRYLLPTLFKAEPGLAPTLLAALRQFSRSAATYDAETDLEYQDTRLAAWVSVASLCVSQNYVKISALPMEDLETAMQDSDADVRLRTLQLLTSSKDFLSTQITDLIKRSMLINAVLPDAGRRSEFGSTILPFFRSIKFAQSLKKTTSSEMDQIKGLHRFILEDFIDPGLEVALRHPIVKAVLSLNTLVIYVDVFGDDSKIQQEIFTENRAEALLACQASNFTDVRVKARQILHSANIPLPGYENLQTSKSQEISRAAIRSLNHPRKTQAEAGKAVLCILFEKLVQGGSQSDLAVSYVEELVNDLENRLEIIEADLAKGIVNTPLHGILAALTDVVACIRLNPGNETPWSPVFHRISDAVQQTWRMTSTVISLAPTSNNSAEHEIARAYEVLGDADEDEEGENSGEVSTSHINLLSGCWRATREAGELLSTIISLPLRQLGEHQSIWTDEEISKAGFTFLTWLHEIRHRGTFSKIASAFSTYIDTIKAIPRHAALRRTLLEHELSTITNDSISTTRRSAALPYSVLAIIAADQQLMDYAINQLVDMARVENDKFSGVTKVHAFNILKIVLLDSRNTFLLDRYFENTVIMALKAFTSADWNVKNVGLILFSSLVNRSLSSAYSSQDFFESREKLVKRQTLYHWHSKYPKIIPYLQEELRRISKSSTLTESGGLLDEDRGSDASLFPTLIIIRSLRWSPDDSALADQLRPLVQPFLQHKQWQVRSVAAQALSSLCSNAQARQHIIESINTFEVLASNNEKHGNILFWKHLVSDVIEWSKMSRAEFETTYFSIYRDFVNLAHGDGDALLASSLIDFLRACWTQWLNKPPLDALRQDTVDSVMRKLQKVSNGLGSGLLRESLIGLVQDVSLDSASSLLSSNDPEILRCVVPRLVENIQIGPQSIEILGMLIALPFRVQGDPIIMQAAFDAIRQYASSNVSPSTLEPSMVKETLDLIVQMLQNNVNVPLRESALGAFGTLLAVIMDNISGQSCEEYIQTLLQHVEKCSLPEESKPARLAALYAIQPLAKHLYPTDSLDSSLETIDLPAIHRVILRLCQDDSEDIRFGTTRLICKGLSFPSPVCQSQALQAEWNWIRDTVLDNAISGGEAQSQWLELLWTHSLNEEDMKADIATINRAGHQTDILFELESPNQFRDPFIDLSQASQILKALDTNDLAHGVLATWQKNSDKLHLLQAEALKALSPLQLAAISPIDETFNAVRSIKTRLELQSI